MNGFMVAILFHEKVNLKTIVKKSHKVKVEAISRIVKRKPEGFIFISL